MSLVGADWLLLCRQRRDWVKGILGPNWLAAINHWVSSDWLLYQSVTRKKSVSSKDALWLAIQCCGRNQLWRNLLNPLRQICENTGFEEGKTGKIWSGWRENKSYQLSTLCLRDFLFVNFEENKGGWLVCMILEWLKTLRASTLWYKIRKFARFLKIKNKCIIEL